MTTIAYKNGILAADTLALYGNTPDSHRATKIMRGRDGALIAMCGDYGVVHSFSRALARGEIPSPLPKDAGRVVEISKKGTVTVHEGGGSYPLQERTFAYGSGSDAARAAMLMGAGAIKAVKVASKVDIHTGGSVRSLKLR